jgi:hypothetical protein
MKKILTFISGAALLAACNSNPDTAGVVKPTNAPGVTILADTSGLSEFQAWKANAAIRAEENAALAEGKTAVVSYDEPQTAVRKTSTVRRTSSAPRRTSTARRTSNRTYSSGSATTAPSTASYPVEQPQQKKGWSKAAKGAVIGGAGGAILGGVISKNNRALGAVIGGVVGGGVGYGIGRSQDKKDGRY